MKCKCAQVKWLPDPRTSKQRKWSKHTAPHLPFQTRNFESHFASKLRCFPNFWTRWLPRNASLHLWKESRVYPLELLEKLEKLVKMWSFYSFYILQFFKCESLYFAPFWNLNFSSRYRSKLVEQRFLLSCQFNLETLFKGKSYSLIQSCTLAITIQRKRNNKHLTFSDLQDIQYFSWLWPLIGFPMQNSESIRISGH